MAYMRNLAAALVCAAALLSAGEPSASVHYEVTINTSSIAGQSVDLAFDLFNNNPAASSVHLFNFSADDASVNAATIQDVPDPAAAADKIDSVSGVTITDPADSTVGTIEYLQKLSLGAANTFLSFSFSVTGTMQGGFGPDALSFFILDIDGFPLLYSDPDGGGALFKFSIGNDPPQAIYSDAVEQFQRVETANGVPEPGTLALAVLGLIAFGIRRPA